LLQEVVSYAVKNSVIKLKKCILEDSYLDRRDDTLLALHKVLHHHHDIATFPCFACPGFGETDWMRKLRKKAAVGHNSYGPPPRRLKQACNKS
jgi:hypothetical protein